MTCNNIMQEENIQRYLSSYWEKSNKSCLKYYYAQVGYLVESNNEICLKQLDGYLSVFLNSVTWFDDNITKHVWHINIIVDNLIYERLNKVDSVGNEILICRENTGCFTIQDNKNYVRWQVSNNELFNLGFIQDIYCWIRRNITYNLHNDSGMVLLHGACTCLEDKAIMILGDKGFGKSYITNHLMFYENGEFVSSDQTIIWKSSDKHLKARGNIASYRIELKDKDIYSDIRNFEALVQYAENQEVNTYTNKNGKKNLPPFLLQTILGIETKQDVQLKYVIILDNQFIDTSYRQIKGHEAIDMISKYVVYDIESSTDEKKVQQIIKRSAEIIREIIDQCTIYVVQKQPKYELFKSLVQQERRKHGIIPIR